MQKYSTSERLAYELVGLSRAAYRYMPSSRYDEEPLRAEVIRMAGTFGGYGYRTIASKMHSAGGVRSPLPVWLTSGERKV